MAPNSLFPSYVLLAYHSSYGNHFMTLPTLQWNDVPGASGDAGVFDTWDSVGRSADDMINDLVDLFAPFFKAHVSFDSYTVYTMATAEATPQPRIAKQLTQVGTNVGAFWDKAVETTFMFRTDLFGIRRLVFLDAPSGNQFNKIDSFSTSPEAIAIRDELALDSNGWSARDNV